MTAQGCVFRGQATAVRVKLSDGAMELSSPAVAYLNFAEVTEVLLQGETGTVLFELKNAVASLRNGKLTVVAEEIRPQMATENP